MGLPVTVVEHALSDKELSEIFPEGYTCLPDEVYKKLEFVPASYEVMEHHIAVYKGKNGKIVKAEPPKELLQNSVATASLVASIMNTKYTNGVPLYRIEQEYERCDIRLSRQTMSHWMITTAERYLSLVYESVAILKVDTSR